MKISIVGISLGLLVIIIYFGSFPTALAGPDITPPILTSVHIESDNADMLWAKVGDTVTLTFTVNESVMTPVVMLHGNGVVPVEGPPDTWTATRTTVGGDPAGPIGFSIVATDLVGNVAGTVTTTSDSSSVRFDEISPMITSAAVTAGNTVTIVYDEPVISAIVDYTVLNLNPSGLRAIMGHGGSGTTTISLTFVAPAADVDEDGMVTIGAGVTDRAGNIINMPGNQALTDGQTPSLTSVSIASNNAVTTLAKELDTVTLSFTSDEAINTPTVSMVQIDGNDSDSVMCVLNDCTATRQMMTGDTEGTIGFSIDFVDNPAGNAGTQVTAINMGSDVTYDETPPILMPVSIMSDNTLDTTLAKELDTVTLTFTVNEALMMAPGVMIDGNAADMVMGGPTIWMATRQMMTGDTEGTIGFSIDTTDLAGNMGTQTTITTGSDVTYDETPPMATAGAIIAVDRFAVLYDAPVISVSGDYTNLMIGAASPAVTMSTSGSATIVVTFNTPPMPSPDDIGSVDIGAGLTDLAGNPIAMPPVVLPLTDGQAPSLTAVTISSTGVGGIWARAGDTVTLSFTANETINTPVVTIGGRPAIEVGGPLMWTATRVLDGTEAEGTDVFTIDFTDTPAGNAGTTVTAIMSGGSVTIDVTAPMVTSAAVTDDFTVTIVYDGPVNTVLGDYSGLVVNTTPRIIDSLAFGAPDTVILSYSTGGIVKVDATGSISIGAGVTDAAGNQITPVVGQVLSDGQPPTEANDVVVGRGSSPSFSSSSSDSITMSPISINGKHYNFIQSGNLVPLGTTPIEDDVSDESKEVEPITNVIKVGQLTHLKFITFTNQGADHIQHAAIYTNLKGNSINPSSDTIGIIYDKGKEIKILDKKNILSHADIKISGEGNRVELKVDLIFSETMDASDLVLRMWDENRFPLYAHIEDAWEVVENPELVDLSALKESTVELNSENPPKEILKEEAVSVIKKWAGYDLEVVSDSQLLNTIGINGDNIPKWLKKSAKWIVNEEISLDEFIDALRFVQNIKT